jgi:hypothetical protein
VQERGVKEEKRIKKVFTSASVDMCNPVSQFYTGNSISIVFLKPRLEYLPM